MAIKNKKKTKKKQAKDTNKTFTKEMQTIWKKIDTYTTSPSNDEKNIRSSCAT